MKRCLLLFAALVCAGCCFCQTADSVSTVRDHYLQKSRVEIPVGAGMLLIGTGMELYSVIETTSSVLSFLRLKPEAPPKNVEAVAIIGAVLVAGSVPLLIIGNEHRRKAAHLKIDMQKTEALLPAGRVGAFYQPALTLTFGLSKRK